MRSSNSECIMRVEGRAGRITLNRPDALNALTMQMVREISKALVEWREDAAVEHIILDGAGDRALCAGGDVISLYNSAPNGKDPDPEYSSRFWRDEYRLNAIIYRYPKPFVALMDGIVMGGGVGLSAHGRHRVVTEKTMVAMPETGIGLIPDVGGTFLLSRAQSRFGEYLGLTGARMSGSDAIQAGFADVFLSRAKIPQLIEVLVRSVGGDVEHVLDEASEPVPASTLSGHRDAILKIFTAESVETILEASQSSADAFAQKVHNDLISRSPLALKITLEAIRRARSYSTLEEALNIEYRLVTRLFRDGEFIEGIRALLVDKDKLPRWIPSTLAGVTPELVESYFHALQGGQELGLREPIKS